MDNKIKDSLFINIDLKEVEKSIDNFLKEKCEGFSAIFLVPKFKDFLVNEVNNINIIFQKELNNLSEKMIDSFKNEINPVKENEKELFYLQDFFPIKNNNQYEFCFNNKYSIKTGKLEKQTIIMIERLDNPKDIKETIIYKISKEYRFFESKQRAIKETLFIGKIEFKKDAEKLFEMLRIL